MTGSMKRSCKRMLSVAIPRVLLVSLLVFASVIGLTTPTGNLKAQTSEACGANPDFPLSHSAYTAACLGKIDQTGLYSFEFAVVVPNGAAIDKIEGSSLAPLAQNRQYSFRGITGGETGYLAVSEPSGQDSFGNQLGLRVSAGNPCNPAALITITGSKPGSPQPGYIKINPCQLINEFTTTGTTSFQMSLTIGQTTYYGDTGAQACKADKNFPLEQSTKTDTCLGRISQTVYSLEFVLNGRGGAVSLKSTGSALKDPPDGSKIYRFSRIGDQTVSVASGKTAGGDRVAVLIEPSVTCGQSVLEFTASTTSGTGVVAIDVCKLCTSIGQWSYTFDMELGKQKTHDPSTGCSGPVNRGCPEPLVASRYTGACLGMLDKGVMSAEFTVRLPGLDTNKIILNPDDPKSVMIVIEPALRRQCSVAPGTDKTYLNSYVPCAAKDYQGKPVDRCGPVWYNPKVDPEKPLEHYLCHPSMWSWSYEFTPAGTEQIRSKAMPNDTRYTTQMRISPLSVGVYIPDAGDACLHPSRSVRIIGTNRQGGFKDSVLVSLCDMVNNRTDPYSTTVTLDLDGRVCNTGTGPGGVAAFAVCFIGDLAVKAIGFFDTLLTGGVEVAL